MAVCVRLFGHHSRIVSQSQVLARKWRPRSFSELTGQEHVVRALTNALEQKRLHHAYLFTGTRGIGKTTLARILAKALNCQTGITPSPCGTCSTCTEIDGGRFVDLIEVDAASSTQVDAMRELLENALYAPTSGRYKVYIIDEVHMLSKQAFNAMLKTLEEPPEHVKFILATTDPQKIPVTVLSRCLQFNLKQIPQSLIAARLEHVLEQEGIHRDAASLQLLARSAQGSMRDALSLLDQAIAFGEGTVGEVGVREMLGVVDQGYLYDLLDALSQMDGSRMLAIATGMEARSLSFGVALQELAGLAHRIALAQVIPAAIAEDELERERIFALAQAFAPEDMQLFYQILIHGRSDLALAPDEYAGFTMTLMRLLAFMPEGIPRAGASGHDGGAGRAASIASSTPMPVPAPARAGSPKTSAVPAVDGSSGVTGAGQEETHGEAAGAPDPSSGGHFSSDDWPVIAARLKLAGLPRMLAQHSEVKRASQDEIEFCVPEKHRALFDRKHQQKVNAALDEYLGRPVRLRFSIGTVTGLNPAALEDRDRQDRQSRAVAAIESDPFVRDLIEKFDAKVISSSIKSIQ